MNWLGRTSVCGVRLSLSLSVCVWKRAHGYIRHWFYVIICHFIIFTVRAFNIQTQTEQHRQRRRRFSLLCLCSLSEFNSVFSYKFGANCSFFIEFFSAVLRELKRKTTKLTKELYYLTKKTHKQTWKWCNLLEVSAFEVTNIFAFFLFIRVFSDLVRECAICMPNNLGNISLCKNETKQKLTHVDDNRKSNRLKTWFYTCC